MSSVKDQNIGQSLSNTIPSSVYTAFGSLNWQAPFGRYEPIGTILNKNITLDVINYYQTGMNYVLISILCSSGPFFVLVVLWQVAFWK